MDETPVYLFGRTWVGFSDTFPFDRFDRVPDEEIDRELDAYREAWLADPENQRRLGEARAAIAAELEKRARSAIHRSRPSPTAWSREIDKKAQADFEEAAARRAGLGSSLRGGIELRPSRRLIVPIAMSRSDADRVLDVFKRIYGEPDNAWSKMRFGVLTGAEVGAGHLAYLRIKLKEWMEIPPRDPEDLFRLGLARMAAEALVELGVLKMPSDDHGRHGGRSAGTGVAEGGSSRPVKSRDDADRRAQDYLAAHGWPGTLRALGEAIGYSHETVRHCPCVRPYLKRGAQPKAVPLRTAEPAVASADDDPLVGLIFREQLEAMLKTLPPEQQEQVKHTLPAQQRELVDAWEQQQRDATDECRPAYTARRTRA